MECKGCNKKIDNIEVMVLVMLKMQKVELEKKIG